MTRRRAFLSLTALGSAALLAPRAHTQTARTLADTLVGRPEFARFADMVSRAGALDDLRAADTRTLFAPTDAAINALPASLVNDLTASADNARSQVRPFVLNHLVQGNLSMADLTKGARRLRTLNGVEIELIGEGNTVALRSLNPQAPSFQSGTSPTGIRIETRPIEVVGAPIMASNGVIYPINGVLI